MNNMVDSLFGGSKTSKAIDAFKNLDANLFDSVIYASDLLYNLTKCTIADRLTAVNTEEELEKTAASLDSSNSLLAGKILKNFSEIKTVKTIYYRH